MRRFLIAILVFIPIGGHAFEDEMFEVEQALADSDAALEEAKVSKKHQAEAKEDLARKKADAKAAAYEAREREQRSFRVIHESEAKIVKLNAETAALEAEIKANQKKTSAAQKEIDNANAKVSAIQEKVAALRIKKQGLDQEIAALREEKGTIDKNIEKGMKVVASQEEDKKRKMAQLMQEKQRLSATKEKYKNTLATVDRRRKKQDEQLQSVTSDVNRERSEVDKLRNKKQRQDSSQATGRG